MTKLYKFSFVFVDERDDLDKNTPINALNKAIRQWKKEGGEELSVVECVKDLPEDWSSNLIPYNSKDDKTIGDYLNIPRECIWVDGIKYRKVDE